jgi:hypothetical protein
MSKNLHTIKKIIMKSCPVGVPRKIIKDSDTQRLKKLVQGNLDSPFSSRVLKKRWIWKIDRSGSLDKDE